MSNETVSSDLPEPPEYLEPATQEWFRSVVANYDLEPHHVRLLILGCECWDRAQIARWQTQFEGITVDTPHGVKPNPAVKIHGDAVTQFVRIVRELGLDVEHPDAPRPPQLRHYQK